MVATRPYLHISLTGIFIIFFLFTLLWSVSSCSSKLIPYQQEGDSIVIEKLDWRYYRLNHKDISLEGEHRVKREFSWGYDSIHLYNGYAIKITSYREGKVENHPVNKKIVKHFGLKL